MKMVGSEIIHNHNHLLVGGNWQRKHYKRRRVVRKVMRRVFIRGLGNSVFLPFKFREIFKHAIFEEINKSILRSKRIPHIVIR